MSPTAPEPSEPTVTQEVLQFLAALYEERSISKAARRLRITVPKSSRLFHEARSVFREELFVRHGREMVPTNFMKNLKPKLETALTAIDDLFRDAVFIPKDCERVVRVSAIDYAMEEILTPVILEIRRVAPGVRFDVRPHDRRMLDFLAEGRLDLCIAPGTADETKTILQHPLYPSRHVYVVRKNHPLAQLYREKGSVTPADIEAYEAIRITSIFDDASLLDSLGHHEAADRRFHALHARRPRASRSDRPHASRAGKARPRLRAKGAPDGDTRSVDEEQFFENALLAPPHRQGSGPAVDPGDDPSLRRGRDRRDGLGPHLCRIGRFRQRTLPSVR